MANCSECSGTGVAERIGGYDRTCDVCRGDGRFPPMTNPKHTSSDPDTQEAIAWANKVIKAKGTSYTPASRNAAAFILASCDRIEALEAANERQREAFEKALALRPTSQEVSTLSADNERLREALRTIRDHDGASYRYGDWVRETARAALKEDTRHD